MKHAVALLVVALSSGCVADVSQHHYGKCAGEYEWEIVPMQVGGQSSNGGGAVLLNKRTGDTWGMQNGAWVPMPRVKNQPNTLSTTQPSLF